MELHFMLSEYYPQLIPIDLSQEACYHDNLPMHSCHASQVIVKSRFVNQTKLLAEFFVIEAVVLGCRNASNALVIAPKI